jgi:hypothetical protein
MSRLGEQLDRLRELSILLNHRTDRATAFFRMLEILIVRSGLCFNGVWGKNIRYHYYDQSFFYNEREVRACKRDEKLDAFNSLPLILPDLIYLGLEDPDGELQRIISCEPPST